MFFQNIFPFYILVFRAAASSTGKDIKIIPEGGRTAGLSTGRCRGYKPVLSGQIGIEFIYFYFIFCGKLRISGRDLLSSYKLEFPQSIMGQQKQHYLNLFSSFFI
eukprot:TRINITY_DN21080_c0_g1_i1.p1 TRINITY_DN21080_c0_g1~~TRINITY_DN21080_c0_g1_i1.p1  ORF type:complete len:105 (+),score=5.25 TRINITY_DN21080_c0_g1_i1:235-549(+)